MPTENKQTNMKTTFKTMILAAVVASLVTVVSAAPPGKGTGTFKKASSVEDIQKIKKGDHYALVCKECDSVTIKEVATAEEVKALCHDGGAMHCGSCQKKFKVKHMGPAGKGTTKHEVTIVNAEGKECMFVVQLSQ